MKGDSLSGALPQGHWPPFYEFLGIEAVTPSEEGVAIVLPLAPRLCNSRGELHGGAIAGLLDIVLSNAVRRRTGAGLATVDISVSYLAAAPTSVRAIGRCVRVGRTIAVATADVHAEDDEGTHVAMGRGIFRVLQQRGDALSSMSTGS